MAADDILQTLKTQTVAALKEVDSWESVAAKDGIKYEGDATKNVPESFQDFINEAISPSVDPHGNPALTKLRPGIKFFNCINGCDVTFRFWTELWHPVSKEEQRGYARLCFAWLVLVLGCQGSSLSTQSITCDFLLFHNKRTFPTNPLATIESQHCNGGVSFLGLKDAQLCVFRVEELFKVFIHETFHALLLHEGRIAREEADGLVGVSSDFKFEYSELYGETWARIMNVVFACSSDSSNLKEQLDNEAKYGWKQCKCVLGRLSKQNKTSQPTPAFEYYCMVGSVMCQYSEFLRWCFKNNKPCEAQVNASASASSAPSRGIDFNLVNERGWLNKLGDFLLAGLTMAGWECIKENENSLACGKSARMTITDVM